MQRPAFICGPALQRPAFGIYAPGSLTLPLQAVPRASRSHGERWEALGSPAKLWRALESLGVGSDSEQKGPQRPITISTIHEEQHGRGCESDTMQIRISDKVMTAIGTWAKKGHGRQRKKRPGAASGARAKRGHGQHADGGADEGTARARSKIF